MTSFAGKTAVITGAAGALGSAVASYFADQGARVAHIDYSMDLLAKTFPKQDNKQHHLYIAADLTSRDSTSVAFTTILKAFGKIDVLANIAGGFVMGEKVHETSDKTWDFLFNLNTRSILNTSAAAVPVMQKNGGGKIINIAAAGAKQGAALMGAYVASKSAVWRLTESMALELRDNHINVNCILPGIIDTARNRADMPNADYSKWVAPVEIAKVIAFLASDDSKMVHGAAIPVVGLG
jgi:NAD(P)-dependent dehydrogenase (short-subunit alcohol dehydrogenase family)